MNPTHRNRWVLAARPATLPASVAPVAVGAALAGRDDVFRPDVLLVTVVAALAIQVGVNFANDLADAARGADTPARIGPTRAVAAGLVSPQEMRVAIGAVFTVATLCGAYLTAIAGPWVVVIGVASMAAALGYTGGPLPYGYHGLGEVFVFVFFGLAATVGSRFVYNGAVGPGAWPSGVAMGCLATALLVVNNVRDLETDRAAGKRTLAVILGRGPTRVLYAVLLAAAFGAIGGAVAGDSLPSPALLGLAALPMALRPVVTVATTTAGPDLIGALRATARLELAVAALLSAGILLSA
ncbi:MAG TPA: 1,4-dihydroxy-2-naphthoate polyprenyltransferase [Acidimicrobiia bacterium]